MACFILLTLAHTLGASGPAEPIYVNRAQIITVRRLAPPDPQRPSGRTVVRIDGPGVVYVTEAPTDVVRAPCLSVDIR